MPASTWAITCTRLDRDNHFEGDPREQARNAEAEQAFRCDDVACGGGCASGRDQAFDGDDGVVGEW